MFCYGAKPVNVFPAVHEYFMYPFIIKHSFSLEKH